ncbi:MAG: cyclic nucleotide-binding domain-containing protein [Bacteriovoracaceae bacterium]
MSYEKQIKEKKDDESFKDDRLNIPVLKYFWQASPLSASQKSSVHKFLRKVNIFDNFSDFELRRFSQFLHLRNFHHGEKIFAQGSGGFGFYLVFSGNVDILTEGKGEEEFSEHLVATLGPCEYFGELSLLEERNVRNATAQARDGVTLLAFFKPDLSEMIERHPVVAAKLLQAVSLIVARRFNRVAVEIKALKEKLKLLQSESNEES